MNRRTPARALTVGGTGLFTGQPVTLTIRPGDRGIRFLVRAGAPGAVPVPAHITNLSAQPPIPGWPEGAPARSTTLREGGAAVTTTEHVLSALVGLGITDADIELDAPEPPIGDGSSLLFAGPLADGGVVDLDTPAEPIAPKRPITVSDGRGASITIEPAPNLSTRYELDYGPGAPLAPHSAEWDGSAAAYLRRIAPARTFCLESEARAMRDAGLFSGLTPGDLLVIGENGPIDNAYRFESEPAAHKLLDLLGDLALAGRPVVGRITARRSGHALNHELVRRLVAG